MKIRNCKLSLSKQRRLFELFLANTSARKDSGIVGVHRNSGIRYFRKIRELIAKNERQISPLKGIVEVGECYIGKQRGKLRERNAQGKIILAGTNERGRFYHRFVCWKRQRSKAFLIGSKMDKL